jgi:hypothetical protein
VIAGPARPQVRLDQPDHRVTGRVIRACGPRARQPAQVCVTEMKHTPSGKSLPSTAGASTASRTFPTPPVQVRVSSRTCGSRRGGIMPGRAGRAHRRDHLPEQLTTQLRLIPVTGQARRLRRADIPRRSSRPRLPAWPPGACPPRQPGPQDLSHLCHQNLRERHPLLGLQSPDRAVELPARRRHQPAGCPYRCGV